MPASKQTIEKIRRLAQHGATPGEREAAQNLLRKQGIAFEHTTAAQTPQASRRNYMAATFHDRKNQEAYERQRAERLRREEHAWRVAQAQAKADIEIEMEALKLKGVEKAEIRHAYSRMLDQKMSAQAHSGHDQYRPPTDHDQYRPPTDHTNGSGCLFTAIVIIYILYILFA